MGLGNAWGVSLRGCSRLEEVGSMREIGRFVRLFQDLALTLF